MFCIYVRKNNSPYQRGAVVCIHKSVLTVEEVGLQIQTVNKAVFAYHFHITLERTNEQTILKCMCALDYVVRTRREAEVTEVSRDSLS